MNLLRLFCPLRELPPQCQWVILTDKSKSAVGESPLTGLPRRADRVQLIIPAPEVLITQTRLPAAARRSAGSVLAFAVEERTVSEPDANQVSWLGTVAGSDVLAVLDKHGLERWRAALAQVGIRSYEVQSEMLLLPWAAGEWSVAWNGQAGFVRTGKLEATATDSGDRESPPLALRLMLEGATANGSRPLTLALYVTAEDALPEVEVWQARLGVPIRLAGSWDWRDAAYDDGTSLARVSPRWDTLPIAAGQLRVAAWIAGIALTVHAVALIVDWTLLASEQRSLRRQMNSQFRAAFPDAVAVVDPLLQMRRKLAEARHAAGQPDVADFLSMIERVVAQMKDLPTEAVRIISYEGRRITLEVVAMDGLTLNRIVTRLRQAGLSADSSSSSTGAGRANAVVTVRVP